VKWKKPSYGTVVLLLVNNNIVPISVRHDGYVLYECRLVMLIVILANSDDDGHKYDKNLIMNEVTVL